MSPTTVYFDMIIHGGLELDGGKVKFFGATEGLKLVILLNKTVILTFGVG